MQHLLTTLVVHKNQNCVSTETESSTKKAKVNDDDEGEEADDQAEECLQPLRWQLG